jgi:hypothetical protein
LKKEKLQRAAKHATLDRVNGKSSRMIKRIAIIILYYVPLLERTREKARHAVGRMH